MAQQISGPGQTGDVYLSLLKTPEPPSRLFVAQVRFVPGARTHGHRHALGQTLHVTEGTGLVGTRDGVVHRINPGQTVWCPAEEDHWHGAAADTYMSHLAVVEGDGEADGTTWLEPVDDAAYSVTPV